ncbi:MAG TPA: hypothetical protein VNO30_42945 [Kofleriaceae bacterium]|nr:hypothetical protein [Kofleriaceae bacterium]
MSRPIRIEVEDRLRFTFERPAWDAVKWDDDPAYLRGLQRHGGKAVDIIATLDRRSLHLFEIKDPRGDWATYRGQNSVDAISQIVADKVRDTLAGLLFCRDRHPCDHLLVHLKALFDRDERVFVTFWLETIRLDPTLAMTLKTQIEKKLRWLNPSVIVTSRALWPQMRGHGLPGLSVESMQGAPWRG